MNYFAHNGVVHSSDLEAGLHIFSDSLKLLAVFIICAFSAFALYGLATRLRKSSNKIRQDKGEIE